MINLICSPSGAQESVEAVEAPPRVKPSRVLDWRDEEPQANGEEGEGEEEEGRREEGSSQDPVQGGQRHEPRGFPVPLAAGSVGSRGGEGGESESERTVELPSRTAVAVIVPERPAAWGAWGAWE